MGRGKGKSSRKDSKTFNEIFEDGDSNVLHIWMKCDNGKSFEKLTNKEREDLWSSINHTLKKHCLNENVEDVSAINNILEMLIYILSNSVIEIESENEFINLLIYINSNVFTVQDLSVRNNVSLINENWMSRKNEKIIPNMEYFTLKYLLEVCSSDRPLVSDIQRLNAIRKFITAAPFETAVPSLRPLLIKFVQNQIVLNSENGQRFLAQLMTLSKRIMLDIHKTVLLELDSSTKKKAACYAKIYIGAWQNAKGEMRNALEKTCFQHLMESFLKEQRTSLEFTKVGQNILAVLELWHSERKRKNSDFITMITDSYQPFIWKYLESGFNVHRCNAADLLFKAFPLQRPGDNVMDAERLFNQQFDAMVSALRDDCHIVRIIAVREVCNILTHYWNSFTPVQIQKLLTIISKEDAHDASTAEVRRMVYVGFQCFLDNPLAFEYLTQILPAMADNIHDVNQRVRIAFIQLLIAVKEKEDANVKFSDLIPTFSLYYRLAEDNIQVGQLIVKLLLSTYYKENMPTVEWTKRFIFLIKTYPRAYRNFFLHSEKILPFSDALTIVNEILIQIGSYVLLKLNAENNDIENEKITEIKVKKMKSSSNKKPLASCNNETNSENVNGGEKNKMKECAFDDPSVVEGLFDIVSILWVLHDNKLNKPENQYKRIHLYETYIKYAQPFINYYKDTSLFSSILSLSGNIPSSLLRSNSITLPGYCMKMLKSNQFDSHSKESIPSLLIAMIKWGKGGDVLEQVTLWLDAAFETQDLNATILPVRRVKISETIQPNSIVAINILDTLMKTDYVRMSVLKKNYEQLYELWKFMSRVKKLIEARLEQGEPYEDELVSDKFIALCFKRYVKLIPLLRDTKINDGDGGEMDDGKELTVNYQREIEELMQWAEEVLYPLLQDKHQLTGPEDISLVTSIYNDILYVADNMIVLHAVNRQFYSKISLLTLKLLETPYNFYFVKSASRIAAAVNYSGKCLFNVNDDLKIFSKMVPYMVSNILNVLTCKITSDEEMKVVEPVMGDVKTYMGKILDTYQDNFKMKINSRETVIQLQMFISVFLDAIVTVLSKDLTDETLHLPLFSNLSQFPPVVGCLISLFYNKKFWSPMFIHVLNATLSAKMYDSRCLLASVSILHFYANNDKRMNKVEMSKTISSAADHLKKLKLEMSSSENKLLLGFTSDSTGHDSIRNTSTESSSFIGGEPRDSNLGKHALIDEGLHVLSQVQTVLSTTAEDKE